MTEEIPVRKKKQPEETGDGLPFFGPMSMVRELDQIFNALRSQVDNHILNPLRPLMVHPLLEGRSRLPVIDFRETVDAYRIIVELPGIRKEKIDISMTPAALEMTAEPEEDRPGSSECIICRERSSRNFRRSFRFPREIVPEEAEAVLENGILRISLPKRLTSPIAGVRKLEIKTGNTAQGSHEAADPEGDVGGNGDGTEEGKVSGEA